MTSSSTEAIIALDISHFLRAVESLQKDTGYEINEEDIFDFVLKNLQCEYTGLEMLEDELQIKSIMHSQGISGSSWVAETSLETNDILYFCLDFGKMLHEDLKNAGAYRDGVLDFYYIGRQLPKVAFLRQKERTHGRIPETEV